MAARAHMCVTHSTLSASKIGLGTLLFHFPLPFSLPCVKESRPTSAKFSLCSNRTQTVLNPCHLLACSHPCLVKFSLCSNRTQTVPNLCHCLARFLPCLVNSNSVTMPRRYEPSSYADLFSIPEFAQCREVFLRAGWGPFLSSLQGHDDGLSMQFAVGFDGKIAHVGSLNFAVTEESIVAATKLPRMGDRWFKNHQLSRSSYNRVFKPEFESISGAKGYAKEWIKPELVNPLIVITRLITCEGRYSTFKACHFRLLAHFLFNKPLNFPFYFLKSLEKMSSQVRKNVTNPHNSLFHHGLIKLLVLTELEKQGQSWDAFIYQFANPHLTVKTDRKPLSLKTISPSKPHSPRTPNSIAQTLSLPEQYQKLVDIPTSSSGKKTKNKDQKKPIVDPPMPSFSLDPTPKKPQEVMQQDFPIIPTNKRGANRFGKGPFRKSTRNIRTKPYAKPPPASDPIQVSSDLESPHKKPREVSADGLEPLRKTKSEPTSPFRSPITPTSPMPTLDPKTDKLSTSLKASKPSSDH
jgi:hypothetical protein